MAWILLTVGHRGMPDAGIRLVRKSMVYISQEEGERKKENAFVGTSIRFSAVRTARVPFTVTGTGKKPSGCKLGMFRPGVGRCIYSGKALALQ